MTLGESDGALVSIAEAFDLPGPIRSLDPLGSGNVNESFVVVCDGPTERRFVLQRLNRRVFPRPDLVMANILALGEHVALDPRAAQHCASLPVSATICTAPARLSAWSSCATLG